jgi:hypothetical protein
MSNVLQLMRQARFEVDAIRTGNATSDLWEDEEVLQAVNTAMDSAAKILRLVDSNILTKTMASTDAAVDLISENYNPASLKVTADVSDYTLPPDFVRVVSILPTEVDFDGTKFRPLPPQHRTFQDMRTTSFDPDDQISIRLTDRIFYYTVLGGRTLRLVPTPRTDSFHIELMYQFRPPKLFFANTGTVQRTSGNPVVPGVGTSWVSDGIRTPAELLVGVTTANGVLLNRYYPTVATIASDTSLTLAKNATVTDGVGQSYHLAMVPHLPDEHHAWLAQMAGAIMMRKVNPDISAKLVQELEKQYTKEVEPELTTRQIQESIPAEPFEIPE